jgi:quinol monooxygenase YgiN
MFESNRCAKCECRRETSSDVFDEDRKAGFHGRSHRQFSVLGDQISRHVELAVKPGQIENFQALTGEMVDSAREEPGVLNYERFVSDDGKFVHVYERYADSAAAVAHLRKFRKNFSERFLAMVVRTQFTVFGNPSDELRGLLDGFGVTYLRPFGDFDMAGGRSGAMTGSGSL